MKRANYTLSGLAFLLAVMAASRSGRADGPDLTPGVWKKITPASVTITPTNHVFCQGVTPIKSCTPPVGAKGCSHSS